MAKEKKKIPTGKIIVLVIIILVVASVLEPSLLFFLTPSQQEVIRNFQETYFTSRNPLQTEGGGFDPLCLISLAILAAECWAISLVIKLVDNHIKLKSRHGETIKSLVCNILKYAVGLYAIIFGLSILGVNMVAVIASLGIIGLIVGFGAESLIEDITTGFFIIFEDQIHVGDIVTIDNFRGTVSSIGIRTTQITDAGGNIKIINNSDIRTLINLSDVTSVAVMDLCIAYEADLVKAEEVVKEELKKLPSMYPNIFKVEPTYVGVQELNSSSVDLRISAQVDEPNIYTARRILNRELKLAMDREGISIPYDQIVVHKAD